MKVDLSCPIELWAYTLPTEEKPACSFTFFNLGERPISSIQITVTCFGEGDEVLSRRVERPMALEASGREPFAVELPTEGLDVDAIDLTIDKAWYEDGDEWRRAQEARLLDYEPNELPPNRKLEQLRYIAGSDAVGYPSDQKNVWICVCGRVNAAEEANCRRCMRDKEEVFDRFSFEAVQDTIDFREHQLEEKARQAREEASRQEFIRQEKARRRKRSRRMRTAVICVVLVLVTTSYLFVVLGMPELSYQTAISALAAGNVTEARTTFVELLDYRNAPAMVKECDLRIATENVQSGNQAKIEEAILILLDLSGYPGAAEMTVEASYQLARLQYEAGSYETVLGALAELGTYKDAPDMLKESEYQVAARKMAAGNYDQAAEDFRALGSYKDSAVQAKECVYLPAVRLMADGQYDEAATMFGSITGYSDANAQRLQCIYQSALQAQLLGDYEYAAERFMLLGNYEDANEQMRHSIWLAANTARDTGKYDTAKKLYESISGYSDADDQARECVYRPAKALMTEEKYAEAAALFKQILAYQNSQELYNQCLYTPAVAAMTAGDYAAALELLKQIPTYSDAAKRIQQSEYKIAEELASSKDYDAAAKAFASLGDYTDAAKLAEEMRYAFAQQAFDEGLFAVASERFAALGKYSDAETRVKECAYELALLLIANDDLEGAYDALIAIEGYTKAKDKAFETIYAIGDKYFNAGDMDKAIEAFTKAGKYSDAPTRVKACTYRKAADLMEAKEYPEAGDLFDKVSGYLDASDRATECYDLWLKERSDKATALFDAGDLKGVLSALEDLSIASLPKDYENLRTMFYESNLRLAREYIDNNEPLEAYGYLLACIGYKNANELLSKNIYSLLGTWETKDGVTYAFYLNGTCNLAGTEGYFNMSNAYTILTGASKDSLVRTHSLTNSSSMTLTLTEIGTDKIIRLNRVQLAEYSPNWREQEAADAVGDTDEPIDVADDVAPPDSGGDEG